MRQAPHRLLGTESDLAYAREQFRRIQAPDPKLPAPAYWDADGYAYVPHDYEEQERDRDRFFARARNEIERLALTYDDAWIEDAWQGYWDGTYAICLKHATPENVVRKSALVDRIDSLLAAIDELDELERPFCDFDRRYFGRPVSRDTHIVAPRRRLVSSRRAPG